MINLNADCVRHISSYLSTYHKIVLSRVCKAYAVYLDNVLNQDPALQCSLLEKIFDKSPRLKLLKRVNQALKPKVESKAPQEFPEALRVQNNGRYRLVFYKDHIDLYERLVFYWDLQRTIKAPVLNHFLSAESFLVSYDQNRIVACMLSNFSPIIIPYDKNYPILNSKSSFCYVANTQCTVAMTDKPRTIDYVGFTFLHEAGSYLHLISKTRIFHYNLKTHESIEEMIDVPEVLRAEDDLLICKTAIIKLSPPKSHTIYKI